MSIDRIPVNDINNNSTNLYLKYLGVNRDMYISIMNNMKLLWDEFWRIWSKDQKKNLFYSNPYLYYYDTFVRFLNKKST